MNKKNLLMMLTMSVMSMTAMADEPLKSGINLADMNTSAKAGDDFYEYACGGWMKANPLPAAQRHPEGAADRNLSAGYH